MNAYHITAVVILAIVALLAVVVVKRRATTPDYSDPNVLLAALADEAVRIAADRGVTLDYSPDSVEQVESLLADLHQRRVDGRLSDDELGLLAHQFGAYIGEVLRRTYGGYWAEDHEVAGPKTFPIHWRKQGESFPVGWCGKRMLYGEEDNVWHKFQMATSDDFLSGAYWPQGDANPPSD
ncbi:MAG: hypothetical protein GXY33_17600 [Phycisphaerae bacterium]|nr:hypothetical protein [Phycisphaerae bacterium]